MKNRHTVFFTLVDPLNKEHKDPDTIDLEASRLAQCMQKSTDETSKYGVLGRHQPYTEERIEVLSDAIERHHSLQYNFQLVVFRKLFGWKLEMSNTRKYMRHLDLHRRSS